LKALDIVLFPTVAHSDESNPIPKYAHLTVVIFERRREEGNLAKKLINTGLITKKQIISSIF
jgi:hypothetical protein